MEMTRRDMVTGLGALALAAFAAVRGPRVGAGPNIDGAFQLHPEATGAGYRRGESVDPDFRFMAH
jgi:hypothetical protein